MRDYQLPPRGVYWIGAIYAGDRDTAYRSCDDGTETLYQHDLAAWSKQQAAALRAAARTGSNQMLDWENLAGEIEDLGAAQRSAIESHILRVIQHLLKLEFSPASEPRNGWRRTIRLARLQIQRRLEKNPSLMSELGAIVAAEMPRAVEYAIADLEE
jgi:Domain of unknown function DUF29